VTLAELVVLKYFPKIFKASLEVNSTDYYETVSTALVLSFSQKTSTSVTGLPLTKMKFQDIKFAKFQDIFIDACALMYVRIYVAPFFLIAASTSPLLAAPIHPFCLLFFQLY
jgi:hypothetical protein